MLRFWAVLNKPFVGSVVAPLYPDVVSIPSLELIPDFRDG